MQRYAKIILLAVILPALAYSFSFAADEGLAQAGQVSPGYVRDTRARRYRINEPLSEKELYDRAVAENYNKQSDREFLQHGSSLAKKYPLVPPIIVTLLLVGFLFATVMR